jgi:prevent-host-death family protein
MKTLPSSDVQARFGEVLDLAKRDPVTVTQYGRPVVVMMRYEDGIETLRLRAAQALRDFLGKLPSSPEAEKLSEEDIVRLVHELRA